MGSAHSSCSAGGVRREIWPKRPRRTGARAAAPGHHAQRRSRWPATSCDGCRTRARIRTGRMRSHRRRRRLHRRRPPTDGRRHRDRDRRRGRARRRPGRAGTARRGAARRQEGVMICPERSCRCWWRRGRWTSASRPTAGRARAGGARRRPVLGRGLRVPRQARRPGEADLVGRHRHVPADEASRRRRSSAGRPSRTA